MFLAKNNWKTTKIKIDCVHSKVWSNTLGDNKSEWIGIEYLLSFPLSPLCDAHSYSMYTESNWEILWAVVTHHQYNVTIMRNDHNSPRQRQSQTAARRTRTESRERERNYWKPIDLKIIRLFVKRLLYPFVVLRTYCLNRTIKLTCTFWP